VKQKSPPACVTASQAGLPTGQIVPGCLLTFVYLGDILSVPLFAVKLTEMQKNL
jgi:hypothetical protein